MTKQVRARATEYIAHLRKEQQRSGYFPFCMTGLEEGITVHYGMKNPVLTKAVLDLLPHAESEHIRSCP